MAVLHLPPLPDPSPAESYLARLGPATRPTMRSSLNSLAKLLGAKGREEVAWARLRYQQTSALRNRIVELYAASTARRHLAALRGVLRQCARLQLMSYQDHAQATDLEPPPRLDAAPRRALSAEEIQALLTACRDGTGCGTRDLALLVLMVSTGLRRAEASTLELDDVDGDRVLIRRGKGGRAREVWLPPTAKAALLDWIRVRGDVPGPLFLRSRGPGAGRKRLGGEAVNQVLGRRARTAGIAHCTAHALRRTTLTALLETGELDLASVQQVAGHANVQTTTAYDCRRPKLAGLAAANAMERLLSN